MGGSWAYDAATRTATFTPSAALPTAHTFTARVNGASDAAGNAMAAAHAWSFATVAGGVRQLLDRRHRPRR